MADFETVHDALDHTGLTGVGGSSTLGELGHAVATSGQTGITSVTDLTSVSVTVTVATGRRIKVTGVGTVSGTASGAQITGVIRESGSTIGRWAAFLTASAGQQAHLSGFIILEPSAGSHTYTLALALSSGSGTVGTIAAATNPVQILVEDIGPA